MNEGVKIKVIKKDEIKPQQVKAKPRSKREAAREIVSNVSSWVNDLQARKRGETRIAVEKLFGRQPAAMAND